MALEIPTIDRLPHHERDRILTQLAQGVPTKVIAKQIGVHVSQVTRYKEKHLKPALAVARVIAKMEPDAQHVPEALRTLDFTERLEAVWARCNRSMDKVEEKDRYDLMAGLLAQAHRNLKLLGESTGQLNGRTGGTVVQVVVPGTSDRVPGTPPAAVQTIEIKGPRKR